jgi:tetratricopeptide (TPR) repeat protein
VHEHLDELGVLRELRQDALEHDDTLEAFDAERLGPVDLGHAAERDAIEQAVALAPDSAALLYRAASLANKAGDHERALAQLEEAVAIDPERKLYRVALERLRARSGDLPVEAAGGASATP